MAPLLCLSPTVLDQSFPRDDEELWRVAQTLGRIQECVEQATIGLVMTDSLRSMADAERFSYDRFGRSPLVREVYQLLTGWVLQDHVGIETLDVSAVQEGEYESHPAPRGCGGEGQVSIWQDEVGRMLFIHDGVWDGHGFFIGVACDRAFAGGSVGEYDNPGCKRCFPLTGPNSIVTLADAYVWQVPHDVIGKRVSVRDFEKNCGHVGAISISPPSSGSHWKVRFENGESWSLDKNFDPIPRDHLRTLSQKTGYPARVLKDCLINGRLPRKVCLLARYQG